MFDIISISAILGDFRIMRNVDIKVGTKKVWTGFKDQMGFDLLLKKDLSAMYAVLIYLVGCRNTLKFPDVLEDKNGM